MTPKPESLPGQSGYVSDYDPDSPTPDVGSQWIWEPNKPHAFTHVEVVEVKWNGEQWWVRLRKPDGPAYWNELSRFWEACKPL